MITPAFRSLEANNTNVTHLEWITTILCQKEKGIRILGLDFLIQASPLSNKTLVYQNKLMKLDTTIHYMIKV